MEHDEPQMEHDKYVETKQQMEHDEFVCGKEIKDKEYLVVHIDCCSKMVFMKKNDDGLCQWCIQFK